MLTRHVIADVELQRPQQRWTRARRGVAVTLVAGLAALAVAVLAVLSQSPPVVLASNAVSARPAFASVNAGVSFCQAGERLPRGTTAIRLSLEAFTGPALTVEAFSGVGLLTAGAHGSGWDGQTVTVDVRHTLERDGRMTLTLPPEHLEVDALEPTLAAA